MVINCIRQTKSVSKIYISAFKRTSFFVDFDYDSYEDYEEMNETDSGYLGECPDQGFGAGASYKNRRLGNPETPCRYIIARVNESIYFFYHSRNITKKFIHESTIF